MITDPVEFDPVPADRKRGAPVDLSVQILVDGQIQVLDESAFVTDEVIVGLDFRVEPVEGTAEIYLSDIALIDQYIEISVNRAHAQVGESRFQAFIHPVRGRVSAGALKQLQDIFPLPAPFVQFFRFDILPRNNKNRNCYGNSGFIIQSQGMGNDRQVPGQVACIVAFRLANLHA